MRALVGDFLRWLTTPWGGVFAAVLLAADAVLVGMFADGNSLMLRTLGRRVASYGPSVTVTAMRTDSGIVILDEVSSSSRVAELSQRAPEQLYSLVFISETDTFGLWAPSVTQVRTSLGVTPLGEDWSVSPEIESQLREALARHLEDNDRSWFAAKVRGGDEERYTVSFLALGHDAVALFFGAALVVVLAQWPARARARRVAAARARAVCAACGYSVAGAPVLDGWVRCPECGDEWEACG